MKSIKLLLPFLFFPLLNFGQAQSNFGRTYTDQLPVEFQIGVDEIRNNIYEGVPDDYLTSEHRKRLAFRFADVQGWRISKLLGSGLVYSDWPSFEAYLNEIFKKVIPPTLAEEKQIQAYLIKKGSYNAFMTATGMTFFHIGFFGEVYDEATIAGVLAHELAHYYLRHSFVRFVKAERGDFKSGFFSDERKLSKEFSINNELQADSLAMVWLLESGYHIDGLLEGFELIKRLEENQVSRSKDKWEVKKSTHPRSEARLEQLKSFINKADASSGKRFLVDQRKFAQFRREAKAETLKLLLEGFNYPLCIEKAFKYHLYDTNNPTYVYYLMEAIRRSCYLNVDKWKKPFITDRYYDVVEQDGVSKKKFKTKYHLFERPPDPILSLKPKEVNNMQGGFYWEGAPKFITYEEAYEFFYKVGKLLEEPECDLSYALSITFDDKVRNKLLEKYLANDNIIYRDFAEKLLTNSVKESLTAAKVTVLTLFQPYVKQGTTFIPIRKGLEAKDGQLSQFFDQIMEERKGQKKLFLPAYKNENLNDYQTLVDLQEFSHEGTYSKGERTELYILDPRYWQVMRKLGVNEIEFIQAVLVESNKREKTKLAYERVTDLDFDTLMKKEKRTKFMEMNISSVRAIEGKVMKVRLYTGEYELKFKKPAYEQAIQLVQRNMKKMDKETFYKDNIYKDR